LFCRCTATGAKTKAKRGDGKKVSRVDDIVRLNRLSYRRGKHNIPRGKKRGKRHPQLPSTGVGDKGGNVRREAGASKKNVTERGYRSESCLGLLMMSKGLARHIPQRSLECWGV